MSSKKTSESTNYSVSDNDKEVGTVNGNINQDGSCGITINVTAGFHKSENSRSDAHALVDNIFDKAKTYLEN